MSGIKKSNWGKTKNPVRRLAGETNLAERQRIRRVFTALCRPSGKSAGLMCHVRTLAGRQGSSGFQCALWKVLMPANISWCVLFYLHSGCCLSQLLLSQISIWMSTLLLQQVMQQQVSLCLSVCVSPVFVPLLPSFHQFCLTAIIMCLPNGIHLESTFSTLSQASLFFQPWHSSTLPPLTLTVMGEREKTPCCCLASLCYCL